jgi:hypothetical protein
MSWETFKQNILRVANSPEGISDINVVAELYAKEYDSAVKRGFDKQHKIKLISGDVVTMKQFFISALQKGVNSSQPYDLVGEMGEGVKAYWAGAVMATTPIPIQPAPGSISNIYVTQNIVTDSGIWQKPTSTPIDVSEELTPEKRIEYQEDLEKESESYNKFIAEGKPMQAQTVSEAIDKITAILNENKDYNTEVPLQDAILGRVPGVVQLPEKTSVTTPTQPNTLPNNTPTQPNTLPNNTPVQEQPQSQEQIDKDLEEFLKGPQVVGYDSGIVVSADNFSTGKPFVQGSKAGGGSGFGAPYVRFNNFSGNSTLGERVVQLALHDAGQNVQEVGKDTGHPRILQIQALGGARIGGGTGFAWCACTVATWWTEAEGKNNLNDSSILKNHPNPAFCPTWVEWAIANGRYVDMTNAENAKFTPKPGDVIVYDWPNDGKGASNHVGIFWKIDGGFWWGVDGNKSGGIKSHCIKNMGCVQGVVRI